MKRFCDRCGYPEATPLRNGDIVRVRSVSPLHVVYQSRPMIVASAFDDKYEGEPGEMVRCVFATKTNEGDYVVLEIEHLERAEVEWLIDQGDPLPEHQDLLSATRERRRVEQERARLRQEKKSAEAK